MLTTLLFSKKMLSSPPSAASSTLACDLTPEAQRSSLHFVYIYLMNWNEPQLIDIPIVHDERGNLSVVEGGELMPFDIKRVYYLYDVPGGSTRGGHAHRKLRQLIFAASGSFDVVLDDGKTRQKFQLNRSYKGLYIPTMTWREIENFSSGAVCMVLASEHYDASDYIYEYEDFLKEVK